MHIIYPVLKGKVIHLLIYASSFLCVKFKEISKKTKAKLLSVQ